MELITVRRCVSVRPEVTLQTRGEGRGTAPLSQGVERLVLCLCDDGHLIATDRIDEAAAFNHGFGAHEYEIDLIHDIRHGGIENDSAWDSRCRELFVCFDPVETRS